MITFNGKKESEIDGVIVIDRVISTPSKKKIKVSVPFMNSSYDFSTVGSNGEITYNQRDINITFAIKAISKDHLQVKYSKVMEWLQDTGQQQLIFDDIPDYYFLAEVETSSSLDEVLNFGRLEVKFVAEPFKTGVNLEGSDIWDTFNFEEDIVQDVEFDVVGTKVVNIYNPGRPVMPVMDANSVMSIEFNLKTYNLGIGYNKAYDLKLQNSYNTITINGTGNIKFLFRKQVI